MCPRKSTGNGWRFDSPSLAVPPSIRIEPRYWRGDNSKGDSQLKTSFRAGVVRNASCVHTGPCNSQTGGAKCSRSDGPTRRRAGGCTHSREAGSAPPRLCRPDANVFDGLRSSLSPLRRTSTCAHSAGLAASPLRALVLREPQRLADDDASAAPRGMVTQIRMSLAMLASPPRRTRPFRSADPDLSEARRGRSLSFSTGAP